MSLEPGSMIPVPCYMDLPFWLLRFRFNFFTFFAWLGMLRTWTHGSGFRDSPHTFAKVRFEPH